MLQGIPCKHVMPIRWGIAISGNNVGQQNLLNCLHVGFTGKHYSGIRQKQSGIDRIRSEKLQPFLNITVQLCFSDRSTASSKRLTKQAVLTSYVELRT
jgi:hypothetical protein